MAVFIHIPRTAGTAICRQFKLENTHHTAARLKLGYSEADWKAQFKFTVIRNPWAQAVSFYNLIKVDGLNFPDWILAGMPHAWKANIELADDPLDQLDFFTDEAGNDLVDEIIRFEQLKEKMPSLCASLGVGVCDLPVINGTARNWNYQPHYNRLTRAVVAERYPKFIERFSYTF